ncbi:MAG: multidrug effflux MFS transporter [Methanomassiliicoccus sp.]|nr:multidrug effflux MFS transporter [Methanomassiliicoccus sp.]
MLFNRATASPTAGRQRILGEKGLIALLGLLSAFVPLSTDLYLPALPSMMVQYQVTEGEMNLTLIAFFITYGLATLVWGPLSDKYGRRPVLMAGLTVYILASLMCALSGSILALIVFRTFQAIGGGGVTAVATATIKDVFDGRKRLVVLAIVQSMVLIAPAVAPVIGALLLQFTTWQGIFLVLAGIGTTALLGTLALVETLDERYTGSIFGALGRLGVVLRNRRFTYLLIMFSLVSMASLSFVAASSYIYVNGFGLTEQEYSYHFALNAMGLVTAPVAYIFLSRRFDMGPVIGLCFLTITASGTLVCILGGISPLTFALSLLPATFCGSLTRAPGTNLILEQQRGDAGSASSLIACTGVLMGSLGMSIVSLDWPDLVFVLGAVNAMVGAACLTMWLILSGTEQRVPAGAR